MPSRSNRLRGKEVADHRIKQEARFPQCHIEWSTRSNSADHADHKCCGEQIHLDLEAAALEIEPPRGDAAPEPYQKGHDQQQLERAENHACEPDRCAQVPVDVSAG